MWQHEDCRLAKIEENITLMQFARSMPAKKSENCIRLDLQMATEEKANRVLLIAIKMDTRCRLEWLFVELGRFTIKTKLI